ncbi:MAG: DEAD/DEAH box helicase [Verrucomicrobium sp.]|nr:DEAD/DEAH box helicase [Verrucomicrobium sp.]
MFEALTHHLKLPDLWQHAAVNHLRDHRDVIVSAPTGAGKTFVFELFVKASPPKGQVVYTVPTRALANDKFAEWTDAGWKVGLATGDRAVNVHAPVLVATLETQIERILTGNGPELLVMDEFQMIGDPARGSHYEGAIVLAPPTTQLLLLSGSVENSEDVAAWMRRLGREVEVVSTKERPVPLDEMPVEVLPQKVKGLEGYWPKFAASALMADLGPVLIFAPRRRDAEKIAKQLADHLPQGEPLSLTQEQKSLAGRDFTSLLEKRIAYHHSGLSYAVRAGLVEPLAKGGQLRVIVSTMGLAAGINFSVRSVHVSSTMYHDGTMEQQLAADELLQMYGRAGRRGLDERGYVLTSRTSPTLSDARAARLRRSSKLSWPLFLRVMRRAALDGRAPFQAAQEFAQRLFAKVPPELGLEEPSQNPGAPTPSPSAGALFGLKGTRHELRNSAGQWEELKVRKEGQVSLAEGWRSTETYHGPALGDARFVQNLPGGPGRVFKLTRRDGQQLYGREIAVGKPPEPGGEGIVPTMSLRKLLSIPRHLNLLTPEQVEQKAVPRLAPHFHGANPLGTTVKDEMLWAQFDYSPLLTPAIQDSLGRWVVHAEERTVERTPETGIQVSTAESAQAARPGTPVHAWRSLGLIDSNGTPTRRGVIFSYFQHGEGLAVAAALEDESYPVEEIAMHLANLRSDCHLELTEPGGSERLAASCRETYGFVNYPGYLEAGLPLGYGEGTAELLGLLEGKITSHPLQKESVAEGDLARAHVEWLSLLRHVVHAPDDDWNRWRELKAICAELLAQLGAAGQTGMNLNFPPLTPKQKHDRPKHFFMRY